MNCEHKNQVGKSVTHYQARWVPSWDENYNENDPQETVALTDWISSCADCGEVLDVSIAD